MNMSKEQEYKKYRDEVVKVAKKYYPYDYYYIMILLEKAIKQNYLLLKNEGNEIKKTLKLKLKKMKKILKILKLLNGEVSDIKYEKMVKKDPNNDPTKNFYKQCAVIEHNLYKKCFKMIGENIQDWWD